MKKTTIPACIILAAALSACGDFEWFPKTADSTAPAVTAYISGNPIFDNQTTHVTALPASVTFYATEAATIYYTTNGDTPDTSSTAVVIASSSGMTGPSITVTDTILKFFGIDSSSNSSVIQTGTINSP